MSQWHVPEDALRAWAEGRGGIATAASVEQHLAACDRCRQAVVELALPTPLLPDLDEVWAGIRERVEPQPMNLLGRLLTRLGMRETDALVLSTASALTAAWACGVVVVAAFTLLATGSTSARDVAVFLTLAPLLPVAGVAAAYGLETDPTHEITMAAPYSKIRLLLLRTGMVLLTCVPLTVLSALPMDGPWWLCVVWLLPAAAFVTATLAAATFTQPSYAAGLIAVLWVGVTGPAVVWQEPAPLVGAAALTTYVVIALVAAGVFAARARHLASDWRIG